MTKDELKLAFQKAFQMGQNYWYYADHEFESYNKKSDAIRAKFNEMVKETIEEALAHPEQEPVAYSYTSRITGAQGFSHHPMPRFVDSESWDIKPLYTQNYTHIPSPKQKVVGWKLVPIKPTDEMLKAMDECSTEGYDERLYAGHAASVYMAAVDVAPTPPQRKPEQEPCTKVECMGSKGCIGNCWNKKQPQQELVCVCGAVWEGEELIYTPPQRKPLTDEEIVLVVAECAASHQHTDIHFARAIEAAHGIKEKNT